MKATIVGLAIITIVFSSCSTAYKTGQTPDDVYYSPTRPEQEYVVVEKQDDRSYWGSTDYYEDRYLRMRVQNRYRWSAFDDYYNMPYAYSPYSYSPYAFAGVWGNPWNSYWAWNSYYNPYCGGGGVIIKNPGRFHQPSKPVVFNPAGYNNNTVRGSSATTYHPGYNPVRNGRYNNSNSGSYNNSNSGGRSNNSLGGSLRKVFSGNNNGNNYNSNNNYNNNNNNTTPSRSYNPSSSSSSSSSGGRSSGSSSGGGGGRPIR